MNETPFRPLLNIAVAAVLLSIAGCAPVQIAAGASKGAVEVARAIDGGTIPGRQLLVVISEGDETSRARLYTMERGPGGWQAGSGPVAAMVGRNGFARANMKREGDGRSPTGLFPLEFVFGNAPTVPTKMPYRQATQNDVWVDDTRSPDYNTWRRRREIALGISAEEMKRSDQRYRYGIVIDYNRHPVIKGNGSAIFVHVWLENGNTTAGCVALDEQELIKIIGWLDPAKRPMILMGDRAGISAIPGLAALAKADSPDATDDLERQVRTRAGSKERLVEYRSPEGFFGIAVPVPKSIEEEMLLKKSWHEDCPVPISDLSYLVLSHWGFDGMPHIGELLVHRDIALETTRAFADLYAARFFIEKMERIEKYDANDDRSMEANNSSAFNCREKTDRPGEFSNHSYGTAIDINPVQNPYLTPKSDALKALGWNGTEDKAEFLEKIGYSREDTVTGYCRESPAQCLILPSGGVSFLDRTKSSQGAIGPGNVIKALDSWGFEWGGLWRDRVDYQHIQVKPENLK